MADIHAARAAKRRLREELAARPGVRGVGLGRGGQGYVVLVLLDPQVDRRGIPGSVDGIDVLVRTSGEIRPHGAAHRDHPAPAGAGTR